MSSGFVAGDGRLGGDRCKKCVSLPLGTLGFGNLDPVYMLGRSAVFSAMDLVKGGHPTLGSTNGMVGLGGFEPPTSRLSGVRSNQLSYRPEGVGL